MSPLMVPLRLVLAPIWFAYVFGYASAEAFVGKSQPIAQLLHIHIGFWCTESYEKTSNKHEFHNLCNHVKYESEVGKFTGHEVWIGTNSEVAERICHKSRYTDKELYGIILEMREITLKCQFLIHFIYVAGSRLRRCDVNGIYRRNLQLENLNEEIYLHLPVNREPILRSPSPF